MNFKYRKECSKQNNKFTIVIIKIMGLIYSQKSLSLGEGGEGIWVKKAEKYCNNLRTE